MSAPEPPELELLPEEDDPPRGGVSEPPELELLPEEDDPPRASALDLAPPAARRGDVVPPPLSEAPLSDAAPWRAASEADEDPWFTLPFVRRTLFQGLGVACAVFLLFSVGILIDFGFAQLFAATWLALCAGASVIPPLWAHAAATRAQRPVWQRVLAAALVWVPCGCGAFAQGVYTVVAFERSRSAALSRVADPDFLFASVLAATPVALLVGVAVGFVRDDKGVYPWVTLASLVAALIAGLLVKELWVVVTVGSLSLFVFTVGLFALILALDSGAALHDRLFPAE